MNNSLAKFAAMTLLLAAGAVAGSPAALAKGPPMAASEDLPIAGPWLRDHLPDDALIYVRLPHPIGLLAMPKGNVLDPALRSRANATAVSAIRRGVSDNVLGIMPAFANPLLRGLERHLCSPIELAVMTGQAPSVLIAASLDVASREAFEDLFGEFAGQGPGLAGPLDERGVGQLAGTGLAVFLRFEASTGRLLANVGPAVSAESFAALLPLVTRNEDHGMLAMERRVDASGHGYLNWIDAERAMPMLQLMMQPDDYAGLVELGLDKVTAAAIGFGVAAGKGRLSVVADVPDENRGLLPFVRNRLDATSVGEPDALLLLSIPTLEEFRRLEARVLESADEVARARWAELQLTLARDFGFTVDDIFAAIGPEILMIFDRAGDYSAIRLRDAKAWNRIVSGVSDLEGSIYEKKRIGSKTYHHLSIHTGSDLAEADSALAEQQPWLAEILSRVRDHAYWVQDGDFLYFGSMPQVLIDRNALRARTDIGKWLRESQRVDAREAVMLVSTTSEKLPGRLYAIYLEILQLLADVGQAEFDAWSMPTAAQLGLPRAGSASFQLSLGNPTLMAEMSFENNPVEMLGTMGGVAAAGIVAAIAIPAYQDYTIRARVAEGLNLAGGPKAAVTEHYFDRGAFPGSADAAAMSVPAGAGQYTDAIIVEPGTGIIVIRYTEEAVAGGGEIYLAPSVDAQGLITWGCSATLADKHLPAACRASGH